MGKESWFGRVWRTRKCSCEGKSSIGVLIFEVASAMSRVAGLWQSLGDEQIARLRDDILNLEGVRKLVSDDDDYLTGLALAEIYENLGFVARTVTRLGKRCSDPVLRGLDAVFDDLARNMAVSSHGYKWEFSWRKMGTKVKKMERHIAACASLYQEMEELTELEQNLRKLEQVNIENDQIRTSLLEIKQKVIWQRQAVKHIREASLWNRSYDYTVRLLARSLITIFERIKYVFGIDHPKTAAGGGTFISDSRILNFLSRSQSISAILRSSVHPSESNNLPRFASGPLGKSKIRNKSLFASGPLGRSTIVTKPGPLEPNRLKSGSIHLKSGQLIPKTKRFAAGGGPLMGCVTGSAGHSSQTEILNPVRNGHPRSSGLVSGNLKDAEDVDCTSYASIINSSLSFFRSKRQLMSNPPPSTLGAAALALHYANVIIVIEKFATCPHLIAPDARNDLYNMLPTSIKAELRMRLKSYTKNLNSDAYDVGLAAEWTDAVGRILEWLAPLAHNMIRWQSERTFEQQPLVSKTNVLLLQTLYFANQRKTEAAITELLVGLNYICRFQAEVHKRAIMQTTGRIDFRGYFDAIG